MVRDVDRNHAIVPVVGNNLKIFFDGDDFVVEKTTLFFRSVELMLVSVDTLFKANQNIGELFQPYSHEKA